MSRNYKIFITCILMLFIIIFAGLNYNVNADMGPKPSITINLKNITTTNYVIDLLEYAEKVEDYYPDSNYSNNNRMYNLKNGVKDKNGITVYFDDIAQSRRNNSQTSRNFI